MTASLYLYINYRNKIRLIRNNRTIVTCKQEITYKLEKYSVSILSSISNLIKMYQKRFLLIETLIGTKIQVFFSSHDSIIFRELLIVGIATRVLGRRKAMKQRENDELVQ